MSKHTSGPWKITETYMVDRNYIISGSSIVAECYGLSGNRNDANLIAAAPDLLEALESMLQSFLIIQLLYDYPIDAPCNKARAAIAKAKGEV